MTEFTDEILMAFVDGELDEAERGDVERSAGADPAIASRIDGQRRLRAALSARYDPILEEPVKARFLSLLEPKVVAIDAARPKRGFALRWPEAAAAMAATFVVGLLSAPLLTSNRDGFDGSAMSARGAVAEALETQLASAQPADAAVRIGVTFAATDGRPCRTFETAGSAGLACRGEREWEMVATALAGGGPGGEYRQAGSGPERVMQTAQEMMLGEPLDAAAEKRARDSGWPRNSR